VIGRCSRRSQSPTGLLGAVEEHRSRRLDPRPRSVKDSGRFVVKERKEAGSKGDTRAELISLLLSIIFAPSCRVIRARPLAARPNSLNLDSCNPSVHGLFFEGYSRLRLDRSAIDRKSGADLRHANTRCDIEIRGPPALSQGDQESPAASQAHSKAGEGSPTRHPRPPPDRGAARAPHSEAQGEDLLAGKRPARKRSRPSGVARARSIAPEPLSDDARPVREALERQPWVHLWMGNRADDSQRSQPGADRRSQETRRKGGACWDRWSKENAGPGETQAPLGLTARPSGSDPAATAWSS
jgi:hypothetical protein